MWLIVCFCSLESVVRLVSRVWFVMWVVVSVVSDWMLMVLLFVLVRCVWSEWFWVFVCWVLIIVWDRCWVVVCFWILWMCSSFVREKDCVMGVF